MARITYATGKGHADSPTSHELASINAERQQQEENQNSEDAVNMLADPAFFVASSASMDTKDIPNADAPTEAIDHLGNAIRSVTEGISDLLNGL